MHWNAFIRSFAVTIILILALTSNAPCQDRRIEPAFPIGAGEKMLVIAGANLTSNDHFTGRNFTFPAGSGYAYATQIHLPVGTTLKRMVVQVADTDPTTDADVNIDLVRVSNEGAAVYVILRRLDTSGVNSSSYDDHKQLTSNSLSHSMLQGWSYWIRTTAIDSAKIHSNEINIANIKIIYEP